MARTKKEVAESAKAVVETVTEKAGAVAETVAEKAEAVVAAAKTAASKPRRTAAKKAAEPKDAPAAKAPRAAKKAKDADKLTTKVVIELAERSASADSLIERAKEDWIAKGNAPEDMKELSLYINAGEGMVYYVVNDDYLSGSFAI